MLTIGQARKEGRVEVMICQACKKNEAVYGDLCEACAYCLQACIEDCLPEEEWPDFLWDYYIGAD